MTDTVKIERFNYVGDDAEMVTESDGEFVRYSDYEQLQSRLAQAEKERSAWLKTLMGCDSVLTYIYHRERAHLSQTTQEQLAEVIAEVTKVTRKQP